MSSDKGAPAPRFFVASKIKNLVKNIPGNINSMKLGSGIGSGRFSNGPNTSYSKDKDDDGMHSFHITEAQQKPFLDCDAIFTDCEEFLKLAGKAIEENNNKGKSSLSKLVHAVPISDQISKWRTKRKETGLFETHGSLQSRMDQMDTLLNDISVSSATSTSALITQSLHLNVRLTSCIEYNRIEAEKARPLVTEGRAFLNNLKSMEKSLVTMLEFMDEIDDLKRTEPKAYVPWSQRQQMEEDAEAARKAVGKSGVAGLKNEVFELKRETVERRLKKIRKVRINQSRWRKVFIIVLLLFYLQESLIKTLK